MLNLPPSVRIHAATQPCDMRKQLDGLAGMVRQALGADPQSGDLFIFRNRRGDMVKVLFFDHQGYCMFVKRLDAGTFRVRSDGDAPACMITAAQMGELLRGIPICGRG